MSSLSRKLSKNIYWLFLFAASFLGSGHVYSVTKGDFCNFVLLFAMAAMLCKRIIIGIEKVISKQTVVILSLIGIMFFSDMLMNLIYENDLRYSLRFFSVLVFSFLFTFEMDFEDFRTRYVQLMTVISGISLVGYVYGYFTNFYYGLPTIQNINDVSYYDGLIFFGINGYSRGRNIGIFWEPGIFAIFLVLAVLFILFDKKKLNKLQMLLLLATLFTTFSTTGYILFGIIIFAMIYFKNRSFFSKIVLTGVTIIGAIIIAVNASAIFDVLLKLFPRVFTKLVDNSVSTTERIGSVKYNLMNFLKSPLIGNGLTRANTLFAIKTGGAQTSTMTLYLSQFGLVGLVYMAIHFISNLKYRNWTIPMNIAFIIVWVITLNVEIVTFFPIIYIISFYFVRESWKKTSSELQRR